MSGTNVFTFAISQLPRAGYDLLTFAQKHPVYFGLSSVLIAAGIVTIVVPIAMGFAAVGPAAGSLAALWQSTIGNVAAGSFFAMLQSLTMNGTLVAVGGGLIGVGVAGLAGGALWMNGMERWTKGVNWGAGVDMAKDVEWVKGVEWAKNVGWSEVAKGANLVRSAEWAKGLGWEMWAMGSKLPIKY